MMTASAQSPSRAKVAAAAAMRATGGWYSGTLVCGEAGEKEPQRVRATSATAAL